MTTDASHLPALLRRLRAGGRLERLLAASTAALLLAQAGVVASHTATSTTSAPPTITDVTVDVADVEATGPVIARDDALHAAIGRQQAAPLAASTATSAPAPPADAQAPRQTSAPTTPTTSAPPAPRSAPRSTAPAPAPKPAVDNSARGRFDRAFPAQAAAGQDNRVPATQRWALLIGINDHDGGPRDNYGSRQDAEELYEVLIANGWRKDHIVLLTDRQATYDNIAEGMAWLSRKTTPKSTAIFHYSGHSKKWYDQDHDGDGEITDEGLWPSDNKKMVDSEMVRRLAGVDAKAFWINIGACNAAGFNDPGLAQPGRLLTFSSREDQKSYEDPSVDNSVWGYYLVDRGIIGMNGDANGDREVTVEEAFNYATPRAEKRTQGQRYGHQSPVVVDDLPGDFSFRIPEPAPQPQSQPASGADDTDDTSPSNGGSDEGSDEGGEDACVLCPDVDRRRD